MQQYWLLVVCALASFSVAKGAGTTTSPGCGTLPADIHFLLDSSGSVGTANFQKQKDFVARFAQTFDIGPRNVQIGVTTFATSVHQQFFMNAHQDKASLVQAIKNIPYQSGSTYTDKAIKYVAANAFTKPHGDRDHVVNILITMTDGQSNNHAATVTESANLHKLPIESFAIGIGAGIRRDELNTIASDANKVFTVTNFNALDSIQAELKKTACEVDGRWSKWGFWSPCTKSCASGTHFRERTCNDPPPANGGKDCVGNAKQTEQCNTQACPTTPPPTTPPTTAQPTTNAPGCGTSPADIVFILDSSGSVGTSNFQKMKDFVETMVNGFDIGPSHTEVGVVTFSDKPHLEFHLNKYPSKSGINSAINNIGYISGGTNTADAIKYARQVSFTNANGARNNAAKVAIIITDGKSNNNGATTSEAQLLRNMGVTVFSIGVGTAKVSELNQMATDPDNLHVFVVNNFDALKGIKGELAKKACEVKATTPPPPQNKTECGAKADIVFLLDSSGSVGSTNFNKMLGFVRDVAKDFKIGPNDVQVGVDTFQTSHKAEFNMSKYHDKTQLLAAIPKITYHGGTTHTGEAIQFLHGTSFSAAAGNRPNVPDVGIVVTDGNSNNKQLTLTEADKARKDGIKLLAIGVGNGINDAELKGIASDPDSQYVFKADSFDALSSLKGLLSSKACEVSNVKPKENCTNPEAQADIVFVLDSSGSVGKTNFDKMLTFVKDVSKSLPIAQDKVRVGLEIFSSRPYQIFNLNKYGNQASLQTAIDHVPYKSGGTNTGQALQTLYSKMFTVPNGDRPNVPNIAIVVTDGKSNHHANTVKEAKNARNHHIEVFSVGVGNNVLKSELNDIASDPDSTHVMTVSDFSKLQQIQAAFTQRTCVAINQSVPLKSSAIPPLIDPCQDILPNCNTYNPGSCTGLYTSWAKANCPRYCGYCATALPTTPAPCMDKLTNCREYDPTSCQRYGPWAHDNCRKFCGFCATNSVGIQGFNGMCAYNGKTYGQGEQWVDGCAYECTCDDATKGHYSCYNRCPSYYNLPPQCTLAQKPGECCLQPVCNFNPTYQTTTGQNVGNLNGINVCVYQGKKYYQSNTWSVGCEFECECVDAGAGMYTCQSTCPQYHNVPAVCSMVKKPGKCCEEPECNFNTQYGQFTGIGSVSGKGVGVVPTAPAPCVDKLSNCNLYQQDMCLNDNYRDWAMANCPQHCNLCYLLQKPGQNEVCVYKGQVYQQGQSWYDGCEYECLCENAKYGYFRCNNRCPSYVNIPSSCTTEKIPGECCGRVRCSGSQGQGTFIGSSTIAGSAGSYPIPSLPFGATYAPGIMPTYGPGLTYAPGLIPTPAPGKLFAPNKIPTPAPGLTYAPGKAPTLAPGQTYPPNMIYSPIPHQTYAPGIVPSYAPGKIYIPGMIPTPAPGLLYAPNKIPTPAPGQTYAPGMAPTLGPGQPFAPGSIYNPTNAPTYAPNLIPTYAPGKTYAPGMIPTPAPGKLYAPNKIPTPAPGQTYAPGMAPTLAPGQTYAPGIIYFPNQTYAPGIIPTYAPGKTYAPGMMPTPAPGKLFMPNNIPTPAPGQTYAPGQVPTLPPGMTYPPGMIYSPGPTYAPGIVPTYAPGKTYAPGMLPTPAPGKLFVPNKIPTPAPGQTYAPGRFPTLAPGVTYPPGMIYTPPVTYAPGQQPTYAPPKTFAPGMLPTPAPGKLFFPNKIPTPAPGQTYAPGQVPTLAPGQTYAPGMIYSPQVTYAPGEVPTYVPGKTFAPNMIPTPAPGKLFAPNKIPTPAPGQTYAPGRYPTLAPGMTYPPGMIYTPLATYAPGQIPTYAPGKTYAPNMIPTPAPGKLFAPNKIPTPAPGQTYAPGRYPTLAPGVTYPPGMIYTPPATYAPGQIPTYAPGKTYAPNMIPTPAPGKLFAPNKIPTPAPGVTYAPGRFPTLAPGQTYAPGLIYTPPVTYAPNEIPTYAPGKTFAPNLIPTPAPGKLFAPGKIPTPAPGQTYAPGKVPTLAPGQTYAPGMIYTPPATYAPGIVPSYVPSKTFAPNLLPTPAPGKLFAPGKVPTPAPGQTYAPGKVPTLAPGQTYPPGMIYTPPATYAPGQIPTYAPGKTYAPNMIPTPAPGKLFAPNKIPTPAPGVTYAPGRFPTLAPGQTYAPGLIYTPPVTYAPNEIPTYAPGKTFAPNLIPTPAPGKLFAPGKIPTPAPGQTYAPGKVPTLAPGQTYAPGMIYTPPATYAPGIVPSYVPGKTFAPNLIPTPAPGKLFAPGKVPTPAPGQTYAPGKVPTLAPGQTYAPGVIYTPPATYAPGQVPTYAPGKPFAPNMIPTPAPGQLFAPNKIPTPAPGQTYAPGQYPTLAPGVTYPPGMIYTPPPTYAPGQVPTYAPGKTYAPNVIPTPAPGKLFAPNMIPTPAPGSTYAPGMFPTLAPGQTYAPGQIYTPPATYAPHEIPTYAPGKTFAPNLIPTPAPGKLFAPGKIPTPAPGQTYAPGQVPTLAPGQTYAPGMIYTQPATYAPGVVPTYAPGKTFAPNLIPTPAPGKLFAPGKIPTPAPGQTYAPGQVPTLAPGQTYAPGIVYTPPATYAPGQAPTYAPGKTFAPNMIPTPAPGQLFAPNKIPTPAPGQTYAPGMIPTLSPGQTYAPGMIYSPTPQPAILVPTKAPNQIQGRIDGCYVNGSLYQQGQRWLSGCDFSCICEDGSNGRYRCTPKCAEFNNLPSSCTMQDNPDDPCCKRPVCQPGPNGQITGVAVPSYKPGFSGYGQAKNPTVTATGSYGNGPSGGGVPSTFTGTGSSHTVSGGRSGCVYKSKVYQQGQTWDDACLLKCTCDDATTGRYSCTDRCQIIQNLPPQCRLVTDPADQCCKTYRCDVPVQTTAAPFYSHTKPASGGDYCVFKGQYYKQGEEWNDACQFKCRCEDAKNQYYQCTPRCAKFENIPLGCTFVQDPKDPTCCKVPRCAVTGSTGTGTSGTSGAGSNPSGYIGSFTGTGRPQPGTANYNPNITKTGYANACIYKGQIYQQGNTWHDGCDYDCECTNAQSGMYRCTDRCPRYGALPSNCHLAPDANDRCCQRTECSPVGPTTCADRLSDCSSYGDYACKSPYDGWAKDNCAKRCGLCTGQAAGTTSAPGVCRDRLADCKAYGTQSCSGQFYGWAKDNCPVFCNLCGTTGAGTGTGGTGTGGTGTGTTGTGTGSGTGTGGTATGTSGTGISGSGTCGDVLTNCAEYTRVSCVDPYVNWAKKNCAKYCGYCGGTGTGVVSGTGGGFSGSGTGGSGSGTQGGISGIGIVTAKPGQISGNSTGCFYKGQLHQQNDNWLDGCQYNCTCTNAQTGYYECKELCPTWTNLPQGCPLVKTPGECCSKPSCLSGSGSGTGGGTATGTGTNTGGIITDVLNGCVYKGTTYSQSQTWDDGCTYKCTCLDASRGYYNCENKCVTWTLPSACHLNNPKQGLCCKTPSCPAGYVLNYPPGYTEQ